MTRRRLVALVSIAVLAAGGLFALAVGVFFTRTNAGHEKLRELGLPLVRRAVHGGSVYIGHLSGNLLTGFTVDSVAVRDKHGDLFLSTGRLSVAYNPRDLIDYRIAVLHAEVEHPYVHLIQRENGTWNFQEIFASPPERRLPRAPDLNTRGWGDYLVFDSTRTRDGSFVLTMPWHPDDTLHGAMRDSVIKAVLANHAKPVVRTADGFAKTWSWTNAHGLITHVRLADPDSDKRFGQQFDIGELAVLEHDPPFDFHHVSGTVRHLGDSVWINVPHFDLPASTGTGTGKIVWGSDRPVRYDLAIHGDSVSLNDVSWVYATLPRTGGGSTDLSITSDPRNLDVLDFGLSNMNVTTTKSHVTGAMTFGVGGPVLQVQNVDLRADPVDFALLRTLNGKPFPEDWEGRLIGTVRGPGGPLTHFKIDDARGQFEDAHVPGAVSRFSGNGELDILEPALTAFHDFHVDAGAIDLRSVEYLFPDVPRLRGIVSGTATLDSSWLDVRVRDAQLAHQDGPGDPSRVSGGGRITWGDKYLTYDLALNAEPLSLPMLARSFPVLEPLHGEMSGPITLAGQTPNLTLSLSLAGSAGALSYDGRADLDSAGGYGAQGHGDFNALSLDRMLGRTDIPVGALSGHYEVDAAGASAATLVGSAGVALERTTVDSIRVNPSSAHVRFADGRILVDSLRVGSVAGTIVATGGIGLPGGRPDSLHFAMDVDSIGGWRRLPFIASTDTTLAGEPVVDSLSGSARLEGLATGRLDSLALNGTVLGSNIYVNRDRGVSLTDTFALRNVTTALTGWTRLRVDTVTLAAVQLDTVAFRLDFDDLTHRRFSVGAHSLTGPTLAAAGRWTAEGDRQLVTLDSTRLDLGADVWQLVTPAQLAFDSTGLRLDSLRLRNRDTAFVSLAADVPNSGAAFAQLRAVHVPLRDVSIGAQLRDTVTGDGELLVAATGTKQQPRIQGDARLSGVRWGGVDFDTVDARADYGNRRVHANVAVDRGGRAMLTAAGSVPLQLTLFSRKIIDDSVSGSLDAENADLAVIRAPLDRVLTAVGGTLTAHVAASGTLGAPAFNGALHLVADSAELASSGVMMRHDTIDVKGGGNRAAAADSLDVQVRASTEGTQPRETLALDGVVRDLWQRKTSPQLALTMRMRSFHALSKHSLADLYLSTPDTMPLRLAGPFDGATLTGALLVDHSVIYLPDADIARKQNVEVAADTTGRPAAPAAVSAPLAFVNNLQANVPVTLGSDVRLTSREADVRLTGDLSLQKSSARTNPGSANTLANLGLQLEGTLTTAGGKYTLNLGIVQRDFDVLSGGTVTFNGPIDNPQLNISAQYNVTQYHDQDLGVIVRLRGPLSQPGIDLTSNADYDNSPSDLLSYLIIGKPGFDFGANPGATQVIASFIGPTLSAVATNGLSRSFGSVLDAVQLQLGAGNQNASSSASQFQQLLYGASIGAERRIGSKLFMSANTGLCQFENGAGQGLGALRALGAKVEYRFDPKLSLQIARDPPTSARFCSTDLGATGLYPTPQNWSLGVSHAWRW